tara:strand:+ start:7309 stop:8010 length:702 start_codon:yes stop_codon:yes gene_type:complete
MLAVLEKPDAETPALLSSDAAYEWIKRRIITNGFHPGTPLDERSIALELDISRTPVREALQRLKSEGFVDILPRKGIFVKLLSRDNLRDLYQVVTSVEVMAVGLIAERRPSRAETDSLNTICDAMADAIKAGDMHHWTEVDEAFHRRLLDLSGNPALIKVGYAYRDLSQRAHFVADRARPEGTQAASLKAHRKLVKTLASGDPERARQEHFEQRETGARKLLAAIDGLGISVL